VRKESPMEKAFKKNTVDAETQTEKPVA